MRTDENLKTVCDNLRMYHGDFHKSCRMSGISADFVMNWMRDDKVASTAIEEAQRVGWMGIESVLMDRAIYGVEKAVYYKGEVVGYDTQYSDTLLLKVAEARVPAYKKGDQGGATFNGPTQINLMPRAENFEQWLDMKAKTLEARRVEALPAPTKVPEILQGDYVEVPSQPATGMEALKDLL